MSSLSIMDFLADKLLSYSSKMKVDSSKLTGSSNLMNDNSKMFSLNVLNGLLGDSSFNSETSNLIVPTKQCFGHNSGNTFNLLNSFKPFAHLFNTLMKDPYHFSHSSETFVHPEKMLVSHIMSSVYMSRPTDKNQSLNCGLIGKEMPLPPVNTETKLAVNISLAKKRDKMASKCGLPNVSTLNKELTNRKTREINKRSRNRRRKQRKKQQPECNNAVPRLHNTTNKVASSVTNLYLVSENPIFECTVSVSPPLNIASSVMSSFIIPVDCTSDDDSEWESYDMNQCDVMSNKIGDKVDSSSFSSHKSESVKTESPRSSDCNFFKPKNFKSSFVVSISSSEDESDLDSSSADFFYNLAEFQFTGLLVTDFCSPKTVSSKPEDSITFTDDEETIKTKALLKEANKKWNEYDKEISNEMKSKSLKVSFAPDDNLVEVFPADIYERKGEWEIYATERLRFKRKIDELEKIISPCLDPKHRSKIFKMLNKSAL